MDSESNLNYLPLSSSVETAAYLNVTENQAEDRYRPGVIRSKGQIYQNQTSFNFRNETNTDEYTSKR